MKRIGVVVAIEIGAVQEKYGAPAAVETVHGFRVLTYRTDDREMYFVDSGAGEIASAAAAQMLISDFQVDMIMNFGVVGALTEKITTAELCVVEAAADADFGSVGWLNLPRGVHPGDSTCWIPADPGLLAKAVAAEPSLVKVRCASTNSFRNDAEDKRALHAAFGAEICEMESAGILYTCRRAGIPCLLLKAVSDSLTGGGAEFLTELNRVSLKCFTLLDRVVSQL